MFEQDERKDYQIVVRLTQQERKYLEAQAQEQKLPLAQAMRRLMRAGMEAQATKN